MIKWDDFNNDELRNEAIVNAQQYVQDLETQISNLKDRNATLQDTTQRLYLKLSAPYGADTPPSEPEVSVEDTIKELFFGKEK